MSKTYQNPEAASSYGRFSVSRDGQMQYQLIEKALQNFLLPDPNLSILDAGCGSGWLVSELSKQYKTIQGIDLSPDLIKKAENTYPGLNFQVADLSSVLPFKNQSFDIIILNLVIHNIEDQVRAFKNLVSILKPGGKILMTSVNPYYGYPVGVWKRSWWQILLRHKPTLKLRAYNRLAGGDRNFVWNKTIPARFSPLPEQINNAITAGLTLEHIEDLETISDSPKFDFQYRLYRFPLITLMIFKK
jgi:ubiquinone/menaquinone biosynthesis C-methylase UbiE